MDYEICPDCGQAPLIPTEGCMTCPVCGFSLCRGKCDVTRNVHQRVVCVSHAGGGALGLW